MNQEVLRFLYVPNIDQLGARCAVVLLSGIASETTGHIEAVTIVARADGSTRSHVENAELNDPPFKESAEQAIRKAKGKALTLLAVDGSLSNKLSGLESEWREATEAVIKAELQGVADEFAGLLSRIRSDLLKDFLRQARA